MTLTPNEQPQSNIHLWIEGKYGGLSKLLSNLQVPEIYHAAISEALTPRATYTNLWLTPSEEQKFQSEAITIYRKHNIAASTMPAVHGMVMEVTKLWRNSRQTQ